MKNHLLVIVASMGLVACAQSSKQVVEEDNITTEKQVNGRIYVNPIADQTAGQTLDEGLKSSIVDALKNRIEQSATHELAISASLTDYTLNIRVIQFTAGNRAARFWLGLGAGAAKLTFICELFDGEGKLIEQRQFQRFGAASLRSGDTILKQMQELLVEYTAKWIGV